MYDNLNSYCNVSAIGLSIQDMHANIGNPDWYQPNVVVTFSINNELCAGL